MTQNASSLAMLRVIVGSLPLLLFSGCMPASEEQAPSSHRVDVPHSEIPDQLLWGDLHVHSSLSFDANSLGNTQLGPGEAYRFAAGHAVVASNGETAQLKRPLDFLLVADHAEYLGVMTSVREADRELLDSELGQRWSAIMESEQGVRAIVQDYVTMVTRQKPIIRPSAEYQQSQWAYLIDKAEQHNRPGEFTTFAGYEWTSMPGGKNLHRVVLFKDGPEKTKQVIPFSALDSDDPEDLWAYMARYEENTSGEVIAIAHNGNLSGGLMFDDVRLNGEPFDRRYAQQRRRWEPVYEVTQVKGDGEAHPLLSPDDRYAEFEQWYETDITMRERSNDLAETQASLRREYARAGLKQGLRFSHEIGVNPFQFGLIGSTDSHTSLATADDDNFWGKFLDSEPGPGRMGSRMGGNLWGNARLSASGYTAVWARANTRNEIFAALKRREVYATTGPRIRLRVFAGWSFQEQDFKKKDFAKWGYANGVPMGGTLSRPEPGKRPQFLIRVLKDPEATNLELVQIVKGWRESDGRLRERVFDLNQPQPDGETSLDLIWSDPDFDPDLQGFYYVRVLQLPSKRWTTYDAERYEVTLLDGLEREIRERAYASPIWYSPDS